MNAQESAATYNNIMLAVLALLNDPNSDPARIMAYIEVAREVRIAASKTAETEPKKKAAKAGSGGYARREDPNL